MFVKEEGDNIKAENSNEREGQEGGCLAGCFGVYIGFHVSDSCFVIGNVKIDTLAPNEAHLNSSY